MHCDIILNKYELGGANLPELLRKLKDVRIGCKTLTGYKFDNDHVKLTDIFGYKYGILFSERNVSQTGIPEGYSVNLWSYKKEALFNRSFTLIDGKIPKIIMAQLEVIMGDYVKGIIKCSGCGKEIKLTDVAGNYFAGRYCKTCWETKYKAIEAAENYS